MRVRRLGGPPEVDRGSRASPGIQRQNECRGPPTVGRRRCGLLPGLADVRALGRAGCLRIVPGDPGRIDFRLGTPGHRGAMGPLLARFGRGGVGQELQEAIAACSGLPHGAELLSQPRILPRHPLLVGSRVGVDEEGAALRLYLGHQDPEPRLARWGLGARMPQGPGCLLGPAEGLLDEGQPVGARGGGIHRAAVIRVEPGGVDDQGIALPTLGELTPQLVQA